MIWLLLVWCIGLTAYVAGLRYAQGVNSKFIAHEALMRVKLADTIAELKLDYDRFNTLGVKIRQLENAPALNNQYNVNRFNEIFTRLVKLEHVPVAESNPHVNLGVRETPIKPLTLLQFMEQAALAIAENAMVSQSTMIYPDDEYMRDIPVTYAEFGTVYTKLNHAEGKVE
jgi:hypothetical protein